MFEFDAFFVVKVRYGLPPGASCSIGCEFFVLVLSGDRRMSKRTGKDHLFWWQIQPRWHEHLDFYFVFSNVRFTLPKTNSSHLIGGLAPKGNSSFHQPTPGFQVQAVSFRECILMESHRHHCFLTATITYRHQPWGNGPEDESGASAQGDSAELCSSSNSMEDIWKPCPTRRSIIWAMHHWTWLLPSSHLESPQHRALFWSFLRPIHTYHAIKRCFAALKHALQF